MTKGKKNNSNIGLITLVVCGVLAIALMIGCVFFPEVIFGLFM